jgi:LmbE family N-acetylglucosaminyl deacetylase
LMAAAVDAGARVVCVTATRGEQGTPDPASWPPDRLARARGAELEASLAVLGVTDHRQLDYPDGGCAAVPAADAVDRLAQILSEVRPDTVLTFGPDGMTGHPDHQAVSGWAAAAVRRQAIRTTPRLLYAAKTASWCERFDVLHRTLGIFPPGLPTPFGDDEVAFAIDLDDELLDRKHRAVGAHASQVEPLLDAMGEATFRTWLVNECFRPATS